MCVCVRQREKEKTRCLCVWVHKDNAACWCVHMQMSEKESESGNVGVNVSEWVSVHVCVWVYVIARVCETQECLCVIEREMNVCVFGVAHPAPPSYRSSNHRQLRCWMNTLLRERDRQREREREWACWSSMYVPLNIVMVWDARGLHLGTN